MASIQHNSSIGTGPLTGSTIDPRAIPTLWASPIAVSLSDAETSLLYEVNDAFCRLFGYERDELVGHHATELGLWADPADRLNVVAPARGENWRPLVETIGRTKTGDLRTVLVTVARVTVNGRDMIAGQLFDITKRRQSEDRLLLLNEVARLGYEASSVDYILDGTLSAVHRLFPNCRASYAAVEDGQMVRYLASCGPDMMPSLAGLQFDLSIAPQYAAALLRGEPLAIRNGLDDPRIRPLETSVFTGPSTAMLDVPVCRNDLTVGLLCLDAALPLDWSSHELTTMQEVAALLAVSLFRAKAEEELRNERELFQTMMDHVPDFLYIKDVDSRFTRVNRAMSAFHNLAPEEYIGKTDFDLFPEHLASQYFADEQQVVASGVPILNRLEAQDANETVWALTSTVPVKDTSGEVIGLVGVARDVSDRQAMETALRMSEERQRALLEAIPDMVFRFNREGVFLDMRVSTQSPYWVAPEQRVGFRSDRNAAGGRREGSFIGAIHEALATGSVATVEYNLERDGAILTFELRVASSGPDEVVAIAHDITERKRLEQRLAFQATHDPLTGLPNRALFAGRIEQALELAKQESAPVAVVFVDLDDFKDVNDTYGHAAGDRLLCAVGDRLRRAVRDGDTVARLAGDEFAILLDGFTTGNDIDTIARRLASRLRQPIRIGSRLVRVTASIGIAIGTPSADDRGDLLDAADRAMYAAKQHGKDRYAILTIGGDNSAHIVKQVPLIPARREDDRRARARRREIA